MERRREDLGNSQCVPELLNSSSPFNSSSAGTSNEEASPSAQTPGTESSNIDTEGESEEESAPASPEKLERRRILNFDNI